MKKNYSHEWVLVRNLEILTFIKVYAMLKNVYLATIKTKTIDMKNVSLSFRGLICLTFVGLSLNAFAGKDKKLKTKADSVSYYIGVNIGQGVQKQFENEKTM
ncbi:MAG: hypothetical protein MI922_16990, partial [Bacteroidales bacterium]|nr:hypothetical protein [Bacteroidales bacterium]